MMKISAIICELNPFHSGHAYIFSEAEKESDVLIAVMSGNFVQRGECAVYHKYRRAEKAVLGGANLCVELPFPFSSSSAEFFARAGVRIAEALLCTDIWFGSECADLQALKKAGAALDNNCAPKRGRAAQNRAELIRGAFPDAPESIISSPNDILAAEYCRYSSVTLHPVKRISAESAASLRPKLYVTDKDAVSPEKLTEAEYLHFRSAYTVPSSAECAGGVGGRLVNAAAGTNDYKEWLSLAATKQYTNSRLRRAALFSLCSVSSEDIRQDVGFTRVLAADEKGRRYLSSIRKSCEIPVITNASDRFSLNGTALKQYLLSERADKLYTLVAGMDDPAFFSKIHPLMM